MSEKFTPKIRAWQTYGLIVAYLASVAAAFAIGIEIKRNEWPDDLGPLDSSISIIHRADTGEQWCVYRHGADVSTWPADKANAVCRTEDRPNP